ncbi:MAG: hypothetical protein HKN76_13605 [Saprospiraceae bacterium]|nr:hypothetical protein [Saprospiraceae bacterium]
MKSVGTPFLTFTDDLIAEYRKIDPAAHRDIIRFYELHKQRLHGLDVEKFLEIELGYTNALFELTRYEAFLVRTKYLLETLIYHNVKYLNGEDVYEKLLLRKAAAHYHILELSTAQTILWQLLKMNPDNQSAAYLVKRCLIRETPDYIRRVQGASIFLFLLSAAMIAVELLIIHPFFSQHAELLEFVRTSVFLSALGLLIGAQIFHRLRSYHFVNTTVQNLKRH